MKEKNIDINKFFEEAKKGDMQSFIDKNLTPETKVKLNSILSDKRKTQEMLNTPPAKELMKKLTKGK